MIPIHKQTVTSCHTEWTIYPYINKQLPHVNIYTEWTMIPYINKQLPHVNIYTEWTMIPIHKQTVTSCQYIYRMDHDTYT